MSSLFCLKETQFDSFTLDSAKTRIRNSKCMKKLNSLISKEIQYGLYYYYIISNVSENTAVNYFCKINNL